MNAPMPAAVQRYTLAEIAEALGITKRSAERRANSESWTFEEVAVRGGKKRLYSLASLPADVREKLQLTTLMQQIASLPTPTPLGALTTSASLPAMVPPSKVAGLSIPAGDEITAKQRDCEIARERILEFVTAFPGSAARAVDHLNAERYAGNLPLALAWAFDKAWDKPRATLRLTVNTLNKWKKIKATRGRAAPRKKSKDMEIKPWYGLLLALRQRPQGSCYNWIHEQIVAQWDIAWGTEIPSYDAIRRVCIEKLSAIDQLKGRFTGSALRAHRHYIRRTSKGLVPSQEVHADGWNTHFTAPHPVTGEFVTYEVWHFHDVATRFVTPPGIGLTETYEVITAGLERYVRMLGMPAILQTDSTKVVKKSPRFTGDPFAALSERAGFTVVHPVAVGNSQANGICENFNTSWLDKQSRSLATYQGKGMDSLTLKRVKKITEKMVKAANAGDLVERYRLKCEAESAGKGMIFGSYDEGEAWLNAIIDKFNDRPHSSLPKVSDPVTGKRRHQTPREALQQHIDAGWSPVMVGEDHLVDIFRPHVRCKVTREAVSPIGNKQRYHFPGLGAWNGKEVLVAVDPMDWRVVWVKTLAGEFIGIAELTNLPGYRAQSSYERAEQKRAAAQIKRKESDIVKIRARSSIELPAPGVADMVIGGRIIKARNIEAITIDATPAGASPEQFYSTPQPAPTPRSARSPDENYADWLDIDHAICSGEAVSEQDARWHQTYQNTAQFRAMSKKKAAA